ncbi:hypothetical protein GT037_009160, partial [Alternaria burnsii]
PAYLDGAAAAHRGQDFHASQSPIASNPHEPMTPIVGRVGPVQRRLSIPQPHRHIHASAAMDARTVLDIATRVSVALARVVWFPISKAINLVIILLLPFYNVITFFLLPFIHLGQAVIRVLSIPFSVKWLERIETLYVYLGTASLIGCITGAVLFVIFRFLSSTLKIDAPVVPREPEKGRTAAEYRAARRVKKEDSIDHSPSATPVVLKKVAGPRRRGLLSQAIIEEEDSDF